MSSPVKRMPLSPIATENSWSVGFRGYVEDGRDSCQGAEHDSDTESLTARCVAKRTRPMH